MEERHDVAKKVGVLGIIGNLFLFIIKIVVGIMSNSRAMIADSLNSAGDIFASFMTYLGNRISSVPNDDDHNFGHGKAEYIFSMLIGISMIIVAGKLLYDSVISIVNGNKLLFSYKLIIISIVTIITKLGLFLYTRHSYQKSENLLIKSNMLDHRNDIVITSFTLIAILCSKHNIFFVDGVVGIGISIWILITGIKLYKESYDVLMDSAIDNKSQKIILNIIKNHDEIKRIGNIYSVPIGYQYIVVITIYVDGEMKTETSHDVADNIEKEILKEISKISNVIVHVEPYIVKSK